MSDAQALPSLQQELALLKTELANKQKELDEQSEEIQRLNHLMTLYSAMPSKNIQGELAWDTAMNLFKKESYSEALLAFEKFIKKYPKHPHQIEAQYLIGKLALLRGDPAQSIKYFQAFIDNYPYDRRLPEATLHLGLGYYAQQNNTMADKIFREVEHQYPDSLEAQQARQERQRLKLQLPSETKR
jgi:tol-pal system protein YbgF